MKAIIWGYKYSDMKASWREPVLWLANSLMKCGVEVKPHPNFKCDGMVLPLYDFTKDHDADICIYNHADVSCLIGNVLKTKRNWFFKPEAVPTRFHTTLDELGYGPYSSITYEKPAFENVSKKVVDKYFDTKVKDWIDTKVTKWGGRFENEIQEVQENDYHLVLGQCGGDTVVNNHDFGNYFTKLEQIIRELVRINSHRWVVVKLHPYTDGRDEPGTAFSEGLKRKLEVIGPKVKVFIGKSNVHNFIKNAYCVHLANSGAGFEAMMHHKPIIAWGFPEYHWIAYNLRHLADMNNAIKLQWFDRDKSDKFLYFYTEKYCFYNQKTSNRKVKDLLEKV